MVGMLEERKGVSIRGWIEIKAVDFPTMQKQLFVGHVIDYITQRGGAM